MFDMFAIFKLKANPFNGPWTTKFELLISRPIWCAGRISCLASCLYTMDSLGISPPIQICPQSWRIKANLHHDDRCVFLEATLPFRIAVTWLSAKDIGNYQCLQVCTFNFKLHIQALQLHVMTWISCVPNKCSIVGNHFGLTHSWNGMK